MKQKLVLLTLSIFLTCKLIAILPNEWWAWAVILSFGAAVLATLDE